MTTTIKDLERVTFGSTNGSQENHISPILARLETLFITYLEFEDPSLATLLSLWTVQSHGLELFAFCGLVSLQSASPRCGKSRVLELLSLVLPDSPTITLHPTASVLFRSTKRSLLLDEMDKLRNQDRETRGDVLAVLNGAFKRGAVVERVAKTKQGFTVESHMVYRAIAVAGLEALSDTLTDRAFVIRMKRAAHRMPRLNTRLLSQECDELKNAIEQWLEANGEDLRTVYESLPAEMELLKGHTDRLQDIAEPLLVLAGFADSETRRSTQIATKLIRALELVSQRRDRSQREDQLLAFLEIAKQHLEKESDKFVETHTLLDDCKEAEALQWIETPHRLSRFLKNFDLAPVSNGRTRGYHLFKSWVEDWEERYQ